LKKAQWGEQDLTPVYQSWNFGEDWSICFWATGSRKSTINNKKKTLAKYIVFLASLLSRLKELEWQLA